MTHPQEKLDQTFARNKTDYLIFLNILHPQDAQDKLQEQTIHSWYSTPNTSSQNNITQRTKNHPIYILRPFSQPRLLADFPEHPCFQEIYKSPINSSEKFALCTLSTRHRINIMPSTRPLISPHSQTISAAAIYHSRKQTSPVPRRCEKFSHPQLSKHVFIISVKTYSVHKALNYGDSFCNNTFLMTGNNFTQMQPLAGRRQLRSHPSRRVETLGLLLCTLRQVAWSPHKIRRANLLPFRIRWSAESFEPPFVVLSR